MQIVIEIDENMYQKIKGMENLILKNRTYKSLELAVLESKVLPEHYGRLGDLDALYIEISNGIKAGNYEEGYENYAHINNMDDCLEAVKYAETIIPATEEGDGE